VFERINTQMDFMDLKFEDNEPDKSDSKREIINFFEKYYLIDEKEVDDITKRVGCPKTINKHGEKLFKVFFNKDTGPADIADFLIDLGTVFKINVTTKSNIKLKNSRNDNHSLKE
jgi:hypothetical protein